MTVHFIGAGPGAPDLITVRGLNLIREAGVILYAGSLVPEAVLAEAKPEARVVDTAPLALDEIITEIETARVDLPLAEPLPQRPEVLLLPLAFVIAGHCLSSVTRTRFHLDVPEYGVSILTHRGSSFSVDAARLITRTGA